MEITTNEQKYLLVLLGHELKVKRDRIQHAAAHDSPYMDTEYVTVENIFYKVRHAITYVENDPLDVLRDSISDCK